MKFVDMKSMIKTGSILLCINAVVPVLGWNNVQMVKPDYGVSIWKKGVSYNADHKIDCELRDGYFTLKTLHEKPEKQKEFVSNCTNYVGDSTIACVDTKVLKYYKKDKGIVFGDFECQTATFTNRCQQNQEVQFQKEKRWHWGKKTNFSWSDQLLSGLRVNGFISPGYDVSFLNKGLSLGERRIKGEYDFVECILANQLKKVNSSFCFDANSLLWITPIGFEVKLNGFQVAFRIEDAKSYDVPRELYQGDFYKIVMQHPENATFRKVIRDEVVDSTSPNEFIKIDEKFFGEVIELQPSNIEIYIDRWLNCVRMLKIECTGLYTKRYQDEKGAGNVTLTGNLDVCYTKTVRLRTLQNDKTYVLNDGAECWVNYRSGHQLCFDKTRAIFSYADSDVPIAVFDISAHDSHLKESFASVSSDGICELKFDSGKKEFTIYSRGQNRRILIKED